MKSRRLPTGVGKRRQFENLPISVLSERAGLFLKSRTGSSGS
jgi:hypothetical protein